MSELIRAIIFSGFWILGLALLLAAVSYMAYQAERRQQALSALLSIPRFATLAWFAFGLIGFGLAGSATRTWEMIIWAVFAVYALASALISWRSKAASGASPSMIEN